MGHTNCFSQKQKKGKKKTKKNMYFKLHLKMRRILFPFFHNKDKKVSSWAQQTTFTLVHIHE